MATKKSALNKANKAIQKILLPGKYFDDLPLLDLLEVVEQAGFVTEPHAAMTAPDGNGWYSTQITCTYVDKEAAAARESVARLTDGVLRPITPAPAWLTITTYTMKSGRLEVVAYLT